MQLVRQAVTMGRALRSRFIIKNRQPLKEVTIVVRDTDTLALLKEMVSLIREELNVKQVRFDTEEEIVVSISAKANFKKLGKLYGPAMKEAAAAIENFSPEQIRLLESAPERKCAVKRLDLKTSRYDAQNVKV